VLEDLVDREMPFEDEVPAIFNLIDRVGVGGGEKGYQFSG
jgi:hypothetical protein